MHLATRSCNPKIPESFLSEVELCPLYSPFRRRPDSAVGLARRIYGRIPAQVHACDSLRDCNSLWLQGLQWQRSAAP